MATERQRGKELALRYLSRLSVAQGSTTVNPFEAREEQAERIRKARKSPEYFINTYLGHYATAPCAGFQLNFAVEVAYTPFIKAFAEWGRGLAKSVWCDVVLPLWLYARGESVFFCLLSNSQERAQELLCDVQAELEGNELFRHDFGVEKNAGDWEIGNFRTRDRRFIGMAFGVKSKVRGVRVKERRPNFWVVDDLETPDTIANPKRMARQADIIERDIIPTMTGKRSGRLLYANNKFARVMTQTILQERHPKWKVFQVKAYDKVTHEPAWPGMYTPQYYIGKEEDMGIPAAYAEFLHETRLAGEIYTEDDIQWADLPPLDRFKMIVAHWDIAYTDNENSDYNAVKVWGLLPDDHRRFLIACYVRQSVMRKAVDWMCWFKSTLPPGTNILFQYEGQFWNGEVQRNIDEAEEASGMDLNLYRVKTPVSNKLGRICTMKPLYQNRRIYYNSLIKSNADCQVGILQLCATGEGNREHDDSPDADQQALAALEAYDTPVRKHTGKAFIFGQYKRKYNF